MHPYHKQKILLVLGFEPIDCSGTKKPSEKHCIIIVFLGTYDRIRLDAMYKSFKILGILIRLGYVFGYDKQVPQPAAPEVSAEGTPPEESLHIFAQIEVVQTKETSKKPQHVGCQQTFLLRRAFGPLRSGIGK